MLGLHLLSNAIRTLAQNVQALADTVGTVNAGLRQKLALDQEDAPLTVPALPGPAPEGEPAGRRNGRKKGD